MQFLITTRFRAKNTKFGFWNSASDTKEGKIEVAGHVAPMTETEQFAVLVYLARATVKTSYRGMAQCRVCSKFLGNSDMTIGSFEFPSKYEHYVTEHGVRPPEEFIAAAMLSHNYFKKD